MSEQTTPETDSTLDPILKRFMATAAKRKAEWDALPETEKKRITDQKEAEERNRIAVQVSYFMDQCRCPKRHSKLRKIEPEGPWLDAFKSIKSKLGTGFLIALTGIRGNGKTQLGVELIRTMVQDYACCRFCTCAGFFIEVKKSFKDEDSSEDSLIKEFSGFKLLVIDEIGQRSESDWENRLLYELINRRYNDLKDTLLITNQDADKLEASLGDSIVSRMRETGGVMECKWDTFRK